MNSKRIGQRIDTQKPICKLMRLSKQLKALLHEQDITVAQVARKAGVSAKTIYNWLGGQSPKDIEAVKKVADHLNVSLDYLCYGISKTEKPSHIEQHLDKINAGIFEVVLRRVKPERKKHD